MAALRVTPVGLCPTSHFTVAHRVEHRGESAPLMMLDRPNVGDAGVTVYLLGCRYCDTVLLGLGIFWADGPELLFEVTGARIESGT